jgi:hypothetical protein
MFRSWLARGGLALGFLAASQPAHAVCSITEVVPTTVLPTMPAGQSFSFVATDDCTTVAFRVLPDLQSWVPTPLERVGPNRQRYGVSLALPEWQVVTPAEITTFTWIASGRTADGIVTRVRTTNELDSDRDGWTRSEGDVGECDLSAGQNPGTAEIAGNSIDDDCDGQVDALLVEGDATVVNHVRHFYVGWALAVGDVDTDGVADLVLGTPEAYETNGAVYLVNGPVDGIVDVADVTALTWTTDARRHDPHFGFQVGAGDANEDGADDVLTGATFADSAYLFLGPVTANRRADEADLVLVGRDESYVGDDVDIVADFGGDSVADLVVGATGAPRYGAVYVVSGTLSGTALLGSSSSSATHTYFFNVDGPSYIGVHDVDIGDATGDGITDLALATPHVVPDPKVYLVEGGAPPGTYSVEAAAWASVDSFLETTSIGPGLAGGDYDADGTVDLFVGRELDSGDVHSFLGPLSGELTSADAITTWETDDPFGDLGTAIALDDIDADDQLDVVMGHDRTGAVAFVQLGWAEGVIDVESLPGFAPPGGGFRNALATIPDWSGDGGAEIAIGTPFNPDYSTGAVHVYLSDRL